MPAQRLGRIGADRDQTDAAGFEVLPPFVETP
jgi:hypothetical protein